jgi:hypothetical protein
VARPLLEGSEAPNMTIVNRSIAIGGELSLDKVSRHPFINRTLNLETSYPQHCKRKEEMRTYRCQNKSKSTRRERIVTHVTNSLVGAILEPHHIDDLLYDPVLVQTLTLLRALKSQSSYINC